MLLWLQTDVTQFVGAPIETKMAAFLPDKQNTEENKNDTKLIALSLKDVDTEIDKFVQANTRELAKDKWLCPLSGKKFKGTVSNVLKRFFWIEAT